MMHASSSLPHLITELARVTRAHPFDRKLLICREPAEGRELLRTLALSGTPWLGWEPVSLRQMAHEVVGLELARGELRTADAFDLMAVTDEAIDDVVARGQAGPFGRDVPGSYREPIRRSVQRLRLAGLDPAAVRRAAPGDAKLEMLASVLEAYESRLAAGGMVDEAALLDRAADFDFDFGGARLFLLPGLPLRGLEGRVVRALRAAGATVLETDAVAGLEAPAGSVWSAPAEATGPLSTLHRVRAGGGAPGGPDGPSGPGGPGVELELFAAATPADELREVVRRVLAAGVPWDRVEIVATDARVYGTALDGLSRRLGIPVTYASGLDVARTRVGRAAEAYFRWIGDGFPVDPIRRLLETGGLGGDGRVSGAALARRLRRLRIGWGHDRYLSAIDRALEALTALERAGPARAGDGDGDEGAARAARERAELEALRSLLAPILEATPRLADRHAMDTARTSPARLAEGLLALLDRVPSGDAVENTARAVLVQRLERARSTLTRETTWRSATSILRTRLDTRISPTEEAGKLAPWTSTGGRLHLSEVATGGLAARPHTFVVGLAAGAWVGAGTDPLLPDGDRTRLNRVAGGGPARRGDGPGALGDGPAALGDGPAALETSAERIAEARHGLAAMLARLRGRVTLSYAAWDMTEGRVIGPAPELLQALRLREGDPTLPYEALRRRLGRLACAVPAPGSPASGLVDAPDVWLDALATPDGRLREGRSAVRAAYAGLDRGLAAAAARAGPELTAYDGLVTADPSLDPRSGDAPISPSRLEALGACPLRYFYRSVLGVRPVRDPRYDAESWLDPLERGTLLHVVYERALGGRPDGVDYGDPAFAEHAARVLDDEVGRMLQRLPAPNDAVLAAERAELEADVRSFVAMVREQRPDVVRTELAFGPDADAAGAVELEVAGGRLSLRGRVDRVDALGGGRLRVVDYKTGRSDWHLEARPFDGGRRLQHLLYALAVERLRPGERVDAVEYHFPTTRGENHVVRYARHALEPGRDVLAALLDLAATGRFLATTDAGDCRICDYGAVCQVRVGDRGASSPRAEWAKATGSGLPEYGPLVRLRTAEDGS